MFPCGKKLKIYERDGSRSSTLRGRGNSRSRQFTVVAIHGRQNAKSPWITPFVTSTRFMTTGRAVDEAVRLSRENPDLSVGLHFDVWEGMVTDLEKVNPEFLLEMLRNEVSEGWTEFSCHAGYASPDFQSIYLREREAEVATLTSRRVAW